MNTSTLLPTVLLLLCLGIVVAQTDTGLISPALAQDGDDDDDDDDGGGGDDDDDGGGSGGSDDDDDAGGGTVTGNDPGQPPAATSRPRRNAPAATPVELPRFAQGELVTLSLSDADLALLLARGYTVLEERNVPELGAVSRRLSVPEGTTLEAARSEVRALASGTDTDFNHYYRSEEALEPAVCEGPHCASFDLIGWNAPTGGLPCVADVVVGVIDTGINPDHPTFASSRLEVHKLTPGDLDPSRAIHGTAVTALLIGDSASRSPGLLPGARVVAVDAFHTDGGDERADVYTLVAAMDFLAAKGVRVVNMSLAGPPNTVLESTVAKLTERDMLLVAATGNVGPKAEPAYPAAYPDVVAVTAVDRNGSVYRRAGRGAHVDLAAPGVEIWTAASIKGAKPKTGTSFAAPFVSAAAAAKLASDPQLSAEELIAWLTASATDLGDPGHDEVYGHGLVQAGPSCIAGSLPKEP
ncbi:S8 family serine peptidase [Tabrizicola sp.]|uniref:S8 family serine peptidase n=1 Tax=Tabrizicola sp. TaxID=2005166 RepID=UPI003F386E02